MKYRYIAVYQIRGLIHAPETGDLVIYAAEGSSPVKAVLTDNIDEYCYELDRAEALGYIMLKRVFGQSELSDLKSELDIAIDKICDRRHKEIDDSEVFIFTALGEAEPDFSQPFQETEDFIIGFKVIDEDKIVGIKSGYVNAALASLFLSTEPETIQVKCVREGVYLINESGKPVYSYAFSSGSEAFSATRTTEEVVIKVKDHAVALVNEGSLARVNGLLVQAISRNNDRLRRFMFGWSALEILINKLFSDYEKLFVQGLLGGAPERHVQRYFERIRDIMKGKYSIKDKFNILAACLSDDSTEKDIENFELIKDKREKLFHGEVVDEDSLPIHQTLELLKKYLRRHVSKKFT